jgi:hypothetical protein
MKKTVMTYEDLEDEIIKLLEFNSMSTEILEDLLTAAQLKDGLLLARVVRRHSNLKPLPAFSVAPALFASTPKLVIVKN